MSLPYIAEPPAGVTSRVRDTDLTNFEAWCIAHSFEPGSKSSQVAFLMQGLGLTGCQAKDILRAHALDQRDADARGAAREEFGAWFDRRGDLLIVRSKIKRAWRVTS